MTICAKKVRFLEGVTLEMEFQNGKIIRYDMSVMFSKYPQLEELKRNRALFESGHLDPGGYAVIWNEDLDFDAMSIYEDGEVMGEAETTINQKIGVLLAKARDEQNVTQTELAALSHINQGDISRIERGVGNPTLGKIEKLFLALGKTLSVAFQ